MCVVDHTMRELRSVRVLFVGPQYRATTRARALVFEGACEQIAHVFPVFQFWGVHIMFMSERQGLGQTWLDPSCVDFHLCVLRIICGCA